MIILVTGILYLANEIGGQIFLPKAGMDEGYDAGIVLG